MMKWIGLLCIAMLMFSVIPTSSQTNDFPSFEQLEMAYEYLISLYNPDLGLTCDAHFSPFNTTYWINVNLLVAYALAPYSPYHAKKINETVFDYMLRPDIGFPLKAEVMLGYDIPDTIGAYHQYVVEKTENYTIMMDKADGEPLVVEDYADLCFYKALDLFFEGKLEDAIRYFEIGYDMFDGIGFYDLATKVRGTYGTYELAICLYTAKVLGLDWDKYPALDVMERRLWEAQDNETGGIITQRDLNGTLVGGANSETTAYALLVYNDSLIRSLNPSANTNTNNHYWSITKYLAIAVVTGLFVWWVIRKLFSYF